MMLGKFVTVKKSRARFHGPRRNATEILRKNAEKIGGVAESASVKCEYAPPVETSGSLENLSRTRRDDRGNGTPGLLDGCAGGRPSDDRFGTLTAFVAVMLAVAGWTAGRWLVTRRFAAEIDAISAHCGAPQIDLHDHCFEERARDHAQVTMREQSKPKP